MVTIWEKDLKECKSPRIIIPFIFYHGKKKWELKKLSEMLTENQSIQKWLIDIPYLLFDTGKNVADFSEAVRLKVSIEMFRKAFLKNRATFRELLKLIYESGILESDNYPGEYIYLLEINDLATEEIMDIIRTDLRIDEKSGGKMTSIAERLRMEGKQEGAFAKAIETCKIALSKGFDLQTVIQLTGLPMEKVLEIQKSLKIN